MGLKGDWDFDVVYSHVLLSLQKFFVLVRCKLTLLCHRPVGTACRDQLKNAMHFAVYFIYFSNC